MIILSYSGFERFENRFFKHFEDYTNFCIDELLSKELKTKRIKYFIDVNYGELADGSYAEVDVIDDEYKEFSIEISPKARGKNILSSVGHEMVHVKQYIRGEMKFTSNLNKTRWRGKVYDERKLGSYWRHPWEIEAYGMEKCLLEMWLDRVRSTLDPKLDKALLAD